MDEGAEKPKRIPGEKKVGADGLTKKERRAAKVETKTAVEKKQKKHKPEQAQQHKDDGKSAEKEQRRKEWEQKLAEKAKTAKADDEIGAASKAELRAKRREQQEMQRLAKNAAVAPKKSEVTSPKKPSAKAAASLVSVSKVPLVHHLYGEEGARSSGGSEIVNVKAVHPAFVRLAVCYSNKTILGSNARCLSLLSVLRRLVVDAVTPPRHEFCRYLESALQTGVEHLQNNRPVRLFAVSMTNALRRFQLHLTQVDTNLKDAEKKEELIHFIDTYVSDEIEKAGEAISLKVKDKITDGDVILTFGCSSLIRRILLDAHREGKRFTVIVADARPLLEGREMLRRLALSGIPCSYVLINAISYAMNSVTKVLMGAHALLANGYVMSRTGTAQVALVAGAHNKPVLVCCETYKFSERVLTDSFVYNEIGDPDKLLLPEASLRAGHLRDWRKNNHLTPLNLLYDVTPPDLVTAVVTELGFLPCTSVPVVLRIKPVDLA